jgi:CHASE2 domain-containing sensor protein
MGEDGVGQQRDKFWRRVARRLASRGRRYWVTSAAVLLLTIWVHPFIDKRLNLTDARNFLFGLLSSSATNPAVPRHVKLVLIGDDEFWDGDLHHRNPTDRKYLASLMRAVDAADASVVALDFDLRLSHPSHTTKPGDYLAVDGFAPYREETDELVRAIDDIAQRRPVVLSKSMQGPTDGPFNLEDDAYQAYGICSSPLENGRWYNPGTLQFPVSSTASQRISCGYIALMTDKRRVPPPARLIGTAARLDSFSLAIVRSRDPSAAARLGDSLYYASYIPEAATRNPNVTISARDVLTKPEEARRVLQGWPVIIGSAWHLRAKGQGDVTDIHDTPIGPVLGALIHENLAEAVLSNRTYRGPPPKAITSIEIVVGAIAALLFGMVHRLSRMIGAVIVAMLILCIVQWLSLQLLGEFIDLFAPIIALAIHALADRVLSPHE